MSSLQAAQVIMNAGKASGVIVRVEPDAFLMVLKRGDRPLVVVAQGGVFKKHVGYLTSYGGLAFYTQSEQPLVLPNHVELIRAEKIWIPDM
ncbi:MAG: hypothetical protein ABR543_17320 [Gemmatimonadaceae bacterium]